MAVLNLNILNPQEEHQKPQVDRHLEQVLEDFISKHGGKALGDLDTPSFMRKECNVALIAPRSGNRVLLS